MVSIVAAGMMLLPMMLMSSCEPTRSRAAQQEVFTRVYYAVDGVECDTLLRYEEEWHYLIDGLLRYVDDGSSVDISTHSITHAPLTVAPGGQTVTYSTTSRQEAKDWSCKMVKRGYTVRLRKDKLTGTYHCTASR